MVIEFYAWLKSLTEEYHIDSITSEAHHYIIVTTPYSDEKETEDVAETDSKKRPEAYGWTPIAITEECLKPSEDELLVVTAYKKMDEGSEIYMTELRDIRAAALSGFVKEYNLEILPETKFRKKYGHQVSK